VKLKLWLAALYVLAACHPQLAAGYETSSHVSGPLNNMVAPVARQPGASDATAPARSVSMWIGGGGRYASIDAGLHLHDIDSQTAMLATASVDCRFMIPFYNHIAFGGHIGPAAGMVVDRTSGEDAFGQGVRFGGLVSANVGAFGVFADVYETEMVFLSGAAKGNSTLTGLIVGVALR
jgi:hypothetical protein